MEADGGSGAGIIDVYINEDTTLTSLNLTATVSGGSGGSASYSGFAGGNGSVNIGTIVSGIYEAIR